MALTPEQIKDLKDQLKSQVGHLPENQKSEAIKQIESLSPGALETMLKQQNAKGKGKSPFRMIIDNEIPSSRIDENSAAMAVLEINPISKAHTIIIPKLQVKDSKEMPLKAFSLAKSVSRKIMSKLKAKSTEIQTEFKLGELIINVIPIYDKSLNINSPRQKESEEELEKTAQKLRTIKKPKVEKIRKAEKSQESKSQVLKLPRKIP